MDNSRKIAFRAWDTVEKKMRYEALEIRDIGLGEGSVVASKEVQTDHPLKWMQYTGLKDRNGEEIWEGDIIATRQHGTDILVNHKVVEWDDKRSGFKPFADSESNCGCCGGGEYPEYCEVGGNIYENPELLTTRP